MSTGKANIKIEIFFRRSLLLSNEKEQSIQLIKLNEKKNIKIEHPQPSLILA